MNEQQGYGHPMVTNTALHNAYRSNAVETMSPGRLVVALYDRLLLDLQRGVDAIVRGDIGATHAALVHAQEILDELTNSLDRDAWPAAKQLAGVYEFCIGELVEANVHKDAARVVVCHDLLLPLRDAWTQAAGIAPEVAP